jgi:hypothetical protein
LSPSWRGKDAIFERTIFVKSLADYSFEVPQLVFKFTVVYGVPELGADAEPVTHHKKMVCGWHFEVVTGSVFDFVSSEI